MKDGQKETQSIVLNLKELEVENRSLKASKQQLEEEILSLTNTLQSERHQLSLKDSSYQEQKRLVANFQEEATRAIEEKGHLSGQLDEADSARSALVEEAESLRQTNARLEVCIYIHLEHVV